MNILQIVSSSRTSGAEKHVVVLSERLRQHGHEVLTLCPPGEWLPGQLRQADVPVVERTMHGLRSCGTALYLNRFVREHKIDLIHSHLTRATYTGMLIGKLARIPVVSSVHVRTRDWVYRRMPQAGNHIITVSDFLREGLLQQGIPPGAVSTIYNGTDFAFQEPPSRVIAPALLPGHLAEVAPDAERDNVSEPLPVHAELSLPPDAELIGIFARVEEFKGHFVLVEAVRRIVNARPRAYFVCVGPVEPHTQRALWELAALDNVAERLRFTGVRNDVQRLMAAMDVVTLPSRYEACSMAIIEAMAMGKPVVATRAGGNPELVRDGETGLLIERNPEALALALISILSDVSQRQRMGQAARARAEAQFSASVMVRQIEALYQDIVERSPSPRTA